MLAWKVWTKIIQEVIEMHAWSLDREHMISELMMAWCVQESMSDVYMAKWCLANVIGTDIVVFLIDVWDGSIIKDFSFDSKVRHA